MGRAVRHSIFGPRLALSVEQYGKLLACESMLLKKGKKSANGMNGALCSDGVDTTVRKSWEFLKITRTF